MVKNPSNIKNKVKRTTIYAKYKAQKKKVKKELRQARVKEVEALGEEAPPKQIPQTIDNTREVCACYRFLFLRAISNNV